jgi:hypothetical protein
MSKKDHDKTLWRENVSRKTNDYYKIMRRTNILNDLKNCVEKWSQDYPEIASIAIGAIIAVKMNRTSELARLIKEFSKSLIDEKSTKKIEKERQQITTLLLRAGE